MPFWESSPSSPKRTGFETSKVSTPVRCLPSKAPSPPLLFQWEFLYLAHTALGTGDLYAIGHPRNGLWRHKELQLRAPLPMTRFHFTSIKGEMQEFRLARHGRSTFGVYEVTSSRTDEDVHPQPRLIAGS